MWFTLVEYSELFITAVQTSGIIIHSIHIPDHGTEETPKKYYSVLTILILRVQRDSITVNTVPRASSRGGLYCTVLCCAVQFQSPLVFVLILSRARRLRHPFLSLAFVTQVYWECTPARFMR